MCWKRPCSLACPRFLNYSNKTGVHRNPQLKLDNILTSFTHEFDLTQISECSWPFGNQNMTSALENHWRSTAMCSCFDDFDAAAPWIPRKWMNEYGSCTGILIQTHIVLIPIYTRFVVLPHIVHWYYDANKNCSVWGIFIPKLFPDILAVAFKDQDHRMLQMHTDAPNHAAVFIHGSVHWSQHAVPSSGLWKDVTYLRLLCHCCEILHLRKNGEIENRARFPKFPGQKLPIQGSCWTEFSTFFLHRSRRFPVAEFHSHDY
jgi:hypothetical protein